MKDWRGGCRPGPLRPKAAQHPGAAPRKVFPAALLALLLALAGTGAAAQSGGEEASASGGDDVFIPLEVLLDGVFDAEGYTNAQAAANFERLVFDPAVSRLAATPDLAEQPPRLLKWGETVRYRVLGDGALRRDTVAAVTLSARLEEAIAEVAPIEIRPAVGDARANLSVFVISFAVRADLAQQIATARAESGDAANVDPYLEAWLADETSPCVTSLRESPLFPGLIAEAMVVVRSEESLETRDQCLQREFFSAFGLLNAHEDVTPSIMNPLSTLSEPTDHDILLTTVLYDPRILPGMDREAAARAAREIIDERRPEPAAGLGADAGQGSDGAQAPAE